MDEDSLTSSFETTRLLSLIFVTIPLEAQSLSCSSLERSGLSLAAAVFLYLYTCYLRENGKISPVS
jgi:uncharacterized membrane protein